MTVDPTVLASDVAQEENVLALDLSTLTVGDLEAIEDVVGEDALDRLGRGDRSAKMLVALMYVAKRRNDPTFTVEDARATKLVDLAGVNVSGGTPPNDGSAPA